MILSSLLLVSLGPAQGSGRFLSPGEVLGEVATKLIEHLGVKEAWGGPKWHLVPKYDLCHMAHHNASLQRGACLKCV